MDDSQVKTKQKKTSTSKNERKSSSRSMYERRPLRQVPLNPPDYQIHRQVLIESFIENEVQFAGCLSGVSVALDVTNRTDVLRIIDRGKREGKIPWKLTQNNDAIFCLSVNDVKISNRDGSEELLVRIPTHEIAAMCYIRDDLQHMVAIKHGDGEDPDETCKLTVLYAEAKMCEALCSLISQCFQIVYADAILQFLDTKLYEGATSMYGSSNLTTSTTTRSDYSNSNRSTPNYRKISSQEANKMATVPGFLTQSQQDINQQLTLSTNRSPPRRKTSYPNETDGNAPAQELVQQYMNRLHTKLNSNELYQFAMLLKAWYTNMPFSEFCTKVFELYGPDRKYLLAAMQPFIPAKDYPEFEEFLEKIGVSLSASHSETLTAGSSSRRFRRTLSGGASHSFSNMDQFDKVLNDISGDLENLGASVDYNGEHLTKST